MYQAREGNMGSTKNGARERDTPRSFLHHITCYASSVIEQGGNDFHGLSGRWSLSSRVSSSRPYCTVLLL